MHKKGELQMAILQPFLAILFSNYINIFHKTEIQTVNLNKSEY